MSKAEELATKMSRMVAITTIQRDTFDDVAAELRRLETLVEGLKASEAKTHWECHELQVKNAELLEALKQITTYHGLWSNGIWAANIAHEAIKKHGG